MIDAFFSVVFLVVMFIYSVKLTFISLGFLAIIGVIYVMITPELRQRLEDKFQMGAHSNSYLVESVTGVQTVKSLAIEGSMFRKWEDKLGKYLKSSFNLLLSLEKRRIKKRLKHCLNPNLKQIFPKIMSNKSVIQSE